MEIYVNVKCAQHVLYGIWPAVVSVPVIYQPTNLVLTLRQQLGPQLCPHHTMLHQQNINHFSAMHAVSPSCQTTKHMPQKYSPLQNMIPSIKTCSTFVAVLTLYSKDLFLDKACIVWGPTIFFCNYKHSGLDWSSFTEITSFYSLIIFSGFFFLYEVMVFFAIWLAGSVDWLLISHCTTSFVFFISWIPLLHLSARKFAILSSWFLSFLVK